MVITNAAVPTVSGVSPNATWTLTVLPDADQDGLPDAWETEHEVSNPDDDPDDDGLTNREEYEAGTDPNAATSVLKIDAVALPDGISLEFLAVSNRTYTVQYNNNLEAGDWTTLADVVARSTNRFERVLDPTTQPARYYRLLTPRTENR